MPKESKGQKALKALLRRHGIHDASHFLLYGRGKDAGISTVNDRNIFRSREEVDRRLEELRYL